jgi:DNA-binding response OmpR family regulator
MKERNPGLCDAGTNGLVAQGGSMAYRVALVDDDLAFAAELTAYLEDNGCTVSAYASGEAFFEAGDGMALDILILDHRLRRENGIEVLRRLRENSTLPCIMLTGSASEVDRIVSLELGADDHVAKTASPRELLARIVAVLRRAGGRIPSAAWRMDEGRRDVLQPDGKGCGLTGAEFRVFAVLASRPGEAVDRETICREALGRAWQMEDRSVDVLITKLRRKLVGRDCIHSMRGLGYAFIGFGAA